MLMLPRREVSFRRDDEEAYTMHIGDFMLFGSGERAKQGSPLQQPCFESRAAGPASLGKK